MLESYRKKDYTNSKINLDNLVPPNHLVRKLEKALNWEHIWEMLSKYYSNKGRKSINPVVLIKMIMLNYVFGIHSMRKTEQEIQVNIAYRWFLGLEIDEKVPNHSTYSKNYERRFMKTEVFDDLFEYILSECISNKFVKLKNIYLDSTHIKANANKNKSRKVKVLLETKKYRQELEEEINKVRKSNNQKELSFEQEVGEKEIKESLNDSDSGLFYKNEREKSFSYTATTACDENGFVLGTYLDSGNKHDSVTFYGLYDRINANYSKEIESVSLDAGYKTPHIAKTILSNNQKALMPYKRPMTKKSYFRKHEYCYDEYYDCYICPNEKILEYALTSKQGYKMYKASKRDCSICSLKEKCTVMETKIVTRHVWDEYLDIVEDLRHDRINKKIYEKRSRTIERVFADLKERHNHRFTRYKGKERVRTDMTLVFACMNLKKLANWLSNQEDLTPDNINLLAKITYFLELIKELQVKKSQL